MNIFYIIGVIVVVLVRQDAEISDALGFPAFKAFWPIRSSGI